MESAVETLRRVAHDLAIFVDGRNIPQDTLDSFIVCLEFVYREVIVFDLISQLEDSQREGVQMLRSCLTALRQIRDCHHLVNHTHVFPVQTGRIGRPSFDIPFEQLNFLIENHFSVP